MCRFVTYFKQRRHMGKAIFLKQRLFIMGFLTCILIVIFLPLISRADGYDEVMKRGSLRHLGVPYAHFVSGSGDGFSVELVQLFASHLGVRYEYVESTWKNVIPDLIGRKYPWLLKIYP